MKRSFYYIFIFTALLLMGGNGCGMSDEEKAAQAQKDSADSVRRADSLFEVQTADMLAADAYLARRADSLRNPDKYLPDIDIEKDAQAFVQTAMMNFFAVLNKNGRLAAAASTNMNLNMAQTLFNINGVKVGEQQVYKLGAIADAGNHTFTVNWTCGNVPHSATLTVIQVNQKHLKISKVEEVKSN